MKSLTVTELKSSLDQHDPIQLIDVREPFEVAIATIGGTHIPMGNIPSNLDLIDKDKKVVVYCKSGRRSANIVQFLEQHGYTNVYNLTGGILAYANEIDPTLSTY